MTLPLVAIITPSYNQGKFIEDRLVDAVPLREVLSSWVQLKNLALLQENANPRLKHAAFQKALAEADDLSAAQTRSLRW